MKMTQKAKVLDYIKKHGSITSREMMSVLWINSPRDIIYELKKDGYKFATEDIRTPSGTYFRRYRITEVTI